MLVRRPPKNGRSRRMGFLCPYSWGRRLTASSITPFLLSSFLPYTRFTTHLTPFYTIKNITTTHRGYQQANTANMSEKQRFPPQMDAGLEFKMSSTYCLGTPEKKKMFCVDFPRSMFKRDRPLAVLHAGPSTKDPPLAICDYEPGNKKTQIIEVPPRPGSGRDAGTIAKMTPYIGGWLDITHSFFAPVGKDGRLEEFHWRMRTTDANINAIGSYGFNLHHVRDGKEEEVVAIMAMGKSMSMSKWYTFAFVGEGLSGKYGEDWEIAAVMGGIRTYYLEDLRIAGTTAV